MGVHIDHDAEEFPYRQLAAILRERIRSGVYPPGARLPSITALTADTGLSPKTIQKALGVLEAEGLARVVPNRGTFVVAR